MSAPRASGGTYDLTTEEQNQTTPLWCVRCDAPGRASTVYSDSTLPVLRISFDARGPGKPGLLCPLCGERPS